MIDQLTIEKGLSLVKYCSLKYGDQNAQFICSKLGLAIKNYNLDQLKAMADKLMIFNHSLKHS